MRFHHSTRRGNRFNKQLNSPAARYQRLHSATPGSRSWSQVNYCRETSIFFNRRQTIEPPKQLDSGANNDKQRLENMLIDLKTPSSLDNYNKPDFPSGPQQTLALSLASSEINETISSKQPTNLDMGSVREKLVAQVNKHPFWSNKAARKMELKMIEQRDIYIYELISFCERRELEWKFEAYKGGLAGASLSVPLATSGSGGAKTGQAFSPLKQTSLDMYSKSNSKSISANKSNSAFSPPKSSSLSIPSPTSSSVTGKAQQQPQTSYQRPLPDSRSVWSIKIPQNSRPEMFAGCIYTCEVPQSSFVKRCHSCQGRGRLKCTFCHGAGYEVCISCSGKGTTKMVSSINSSASYGRSRDYQSNSRSSWYENENSLTSANSDFKRSFGEPGGVTGSSSSNCSAYNNTSSSAWATESCHFCHGAGQKRCWICSGRANIQCQLCMGSGQLRCYLNLVVTWINHRDEYTSNNDDNIIPKDRLRLSSGLTIFDEIGDALVPLRKCSIDNFLGNENASKDATLLNINSKKLLEKHQTQYHQQEQLLKQRHRVTRIECFIVNYEWKKRNGHFVIHGDERKVYIAKYPFKSICNIT